MKFIGLQKAVKRLKEDTKRYENATKAAVLLMGIAMVKDSQPDVPVRTGALKRSAFVRVIKSRAHGVIAKAGYSMPYAGAISKGSRVTKTGKKTVYRLKNGKTRFFYTAARKRKAGYLQAMTTLIKYAYANKLTADNVQNPYQSRADQWKAFRRAIRTEIKKQRRAARDAQKLGA